METAAFYVSLAEAKKELAKRKKLRAQVETWWAKQKWVIPALFYDHHDIAGFGRSIATFRYEDALFIEYAKAAGLTPYWLEYTAGKFSTESRLKKSFLRPQFFAHRGARKQGPLMHPVHLAPFQKWRGKPLDQIVQIHTGTSLVDYHHGLHDARIPYSRIDLSDFYGQFGNAQHYYEPYLSLFLAHGVLFEDYHGGESGDALVTLTQQTFVPAFRSLQERFGVSPLIVSMPWHPHLRYYPRPGTDWHLDKMIPEKLFPKP